MKFTSNTQDFLTACSKAARATGKKQFETSEMLLIEAHGPYGIATGYDLTLGISALFGIALEHDGKIADTENALGLSAVLLLHKSRCRARL